jgi:hypothetical protein
MEKHVIMITDMTLKNVKMKRIFHRIAAQALVSFRNIDTYHAMSYIPERFTCRSFDTRRK